MHHCRAVADVRMNQVADAAFIVTNGTPGNRLSPTQTLSSSIVTNFYIGQRMVMFGGITGVRQGEVTSLPVHATIGGHRINQPVVTNIVSEVGNSGGLVTTFNGFITAGIVWGGVTGHPDMLFIRASAVNSALGLRIH